MKKDANGRIVLKENFFLKYLWGTNFWRFMMNKTFRWNLIKNNPLKPKNLCSLFWGSVLVAPLCWIFTIPLALVFFILVVMLFGCLCLTSAISFLFGFMMVSFLHPERYQYHHSEKMFEFHPYRRYGRGDEKRMLIAPWYIWLPTLLVWLLIKKNFLIPRTIINFFTWVFSHPTGLIISGGIVGIIFLVLFFNSNAGKICWEFIKATKKKFCPLITIEK